jgi:hypothetical protein
VAGGGSSAVTSFDSSANSFAGNTAPQRGAAVAAGTGFAGGSSCSKLVNGGDDGIAAPASNGLSTEPRTQARRNSHADGAKRCHSTKSRSALTIGQSAGSGASVSQKHSSPPGPSAHGSRPPGSGYMGYGNSAKPPSRQARMSSSRYA